MNCTLHGFVKVLKIRNKQRKKEQERMKNGRGKLYSNIQGILDIPYLKRRHWHQQLDIFSNDGFGKSKPVIVEIHGGGLVSCTKDINRLHAKALASYGFYVVNIDYRLQPEVEFFEQLEDVMSALVWIKNNSARYGFDTEHVFLDGDSAGGYIALLSTVAINNSEFREYFGLLKPEINLCGTCVNCSLHDLRRYTTRKDTDYPDQISINVFFRRANDEKYISSCSISNWIGRCNFPPLMITTTKSDQNCYSDTNQLHLLLDNSHIEHLYREYEGSSHQLGHVFNVLFPEWEESSIANKEISEFFWKLCQ